MKFDFKKVIPHALAIVVFLIVSLVYTKPALDGKVLQQSDMTQWKGMSKDAENYKVKHGVYPEWTNNMFSGMPSYQIAFNNNATLPGWVAQVLGLHLPTPTLYFFLACVCMYILALVLGLGPWIGIFGALAFAFSTYNPIIVATGHHTKMMSLALIPAILAGLYLIYEKKYWLGAVLTAFGTAGLFAYAHYQVIFYFFMIVAFMGIAYWITSIKAGQIKQMIVGTIIAAMAIVLGIMANSVTIMTTFDYSKATIRDGSALAKTKAADKSTSIAPSQISATGLDSAYAFSYSMSVPEPLVMVVPRLFGGGGNDPLPEDGKTVEALSDVSSKFGQQAAQQLSQGLGAYWGGIGSTVGPPYSGAIICVLALFGMFIIDKKYKWWMASIILLSIIMSWGGYFYSFNGWLLNHLPYYNKFRAPSMIIVIPQILLPIMAMLTIQKLTSTNFDLAANKIKIRNGLIAVGVLLILIIGFYFTSSFLSNYDQQGLKQVSTSTQMAPEVKQVYKQLYTALAEDRQTIALHDILRMMFILIIGAAIIFACLKKWIKPVVAICVLAAVSFIDLITIDNKYLSSESYQEPNESNGIILEPELTEQPINAQIVKMGKESGDTIYRVFDARQSRTIGSQRIGVSPFQDASQAYYHNMVGGYHPAKLSNYQDLWENQISKGNQDALDMLNTRYIMVNDQRGGDSVMVNPNANGPAWFVKHIEYVDGPAAIMKRLDHFSSKDTAIVDKQYQTTIGNQPQFDSAASIKVTLYDNDNLAYAIDTKSNQFAVLSEVYYKNGWQAFVDGKETPIVPVDYVLRGIVIPAGTKKLELVFTPKSYLTGKMLTNVASIIMLILLAVAIVFDFRKKKIA